MKPLGASVLPSIILSHYCTSVQVALGRQTQLPQHRKNLGPTKIRSSAQIKILQTKYDYFYIMQTDLIFWYNTRNAKMRAGEARPSKKDMIILVVAYGTQSLNWEKCRAWWSSICPHLPRCLCPVLQVWQGPWWGEKSSILRKWIRRQFWMTSNWQVETFCGCVRRFHFAKSFWIKHIRIIREKFERPTRYVTQYLHVLAQSRTSLSFSCCRYFGHSFSCVCAQSMPNGASSMFATSSAPFKARTWQQHPSPSPAERRLFFSSILIVNTSLGKSSTLRRIFPVG